MAENGAAATDHASPTTAAAFGNEGSSRKPGANPSETFVNMLGEMVDQNDVRDIAAQQALM